MIGASGVKEFTAGIIHFIFFVLKPISGQCFISYPLKTFSGGIETKYSLAMAKFKMIMNGVERLVVKQ